MKQFKQLIVIVILMGIGSLLIAQDWTFGGSVRIRHEAMNKDFSDTSGFNNLNYQRTRFSAKYKKGNKFIFLQLQDSRVMGTETNTLNDGSADALDMHQAYFMLDNNGPLSLKMGRYEVAYGSQRLVGSVGWHNIGRSFDGYTLLYQLSNESKIEIFNLKQVDGYPDKEANDINVRGANIFFSNSLPFVKEGLLLQDKDRTTGLLTLGKKSGLFSFNGELGFQSGKHNEKNLAGWLVSVSGSYKINSVVFRAGVDIVSGDDTTTTEDESFYTLFATNHKFYGHMDYFLNLPVHTKGLGLVDAQFQVVTTILGRKLNTTVHQFYSHKNNLEGKNVFGTEIDNSLILPFIGKSKMVLGHSFFFPGELFAEDGEMAQWGYFMISVNL
jgi:hypothetical protein